jgi:hypothetical protein
VSRERLASADSRPGSPLVDAIAAITIAALFSGLNWRLGPIKVQLSDVLAALTIFVIVLRGFSTPKLSVPVLLLLSAYLCYYGVSALQVDLVLGVKEVVQIALLFSFLFVVMGYYGAHSTSRLLVACSLLLLGLLVYNIAWHVSQGFYVGWKQLNEPKTIFTLLPLVLILLSDRFGAHIRAPVLALSVVAAALILLSGERKAYIFAVVALAIWTAPYSWRHLLVGALLAPVLWAGLAFDQTGYLDRQVGSISARLPGEGVETATFNHLLDESRPGTVSDAQREFTKRLATELWRREPVFGIGTNGYEKALENYTSLPEIFRLGIHGEFYRALYENGIVGLALYASVWLAALVHVLLAWKAAGARGPQNLNKIRLLCISMFLIYCSLEGGKGLTQLCLCALPFIPALAWRRTIPSRIPVAATMTPRSVRIGGVSNGM